MLNQLQEELKLAMKSGNKAAMTGFRNIIGKIKTAQIDKGESLSYEQSLKILKSAAKQLRESVEHYNKGGREDLAEKELFELSIVEKFLPKQLSDDKIRKIVKETIQSSGADSIQDLGRVMGILMKKLTESADGQLVQKVVREELN